MSFTRKYFGENWNRINVASRIFWFATGASIFVLGFSFLAQICSEYFALPIDSLVPIFQTKQLPKMFIFAGSLAVFGFVAWIIGHLLFMREHRMTREEIQREARQ